ncbi:MAG: mannose-1-phosphate guanylyltransferase/mannose-6-phosphate isomerase [Candidatus Accumulibacter sp.]|jgi:mannose-1-phosphate guanylyltransferase/mannose-6-phosphate isomerase|nr:mannose-1-phosphate guanylyltransferase/mannose-6-phosphate isomerase [Accumulibacter sp.]
MLNENAPTLTPVILCGGSGTRLWPLSRKSFPKQFVPLLGRKSLLELTLERAASVSRGAPPLFVAAQEHRFMVTDILQSMKQGGDLLLEPVPRNTAAAIALAALYAFRSGDEMLLFCPADHHIPDAGAFSRVVHQGVPAASSGAIVTFGVRPSFPSTAYGYIRQGRRLDAHTFEAARFIEKPDAESARELVLSGDALWNSGIFLSSAGTMLAALEKHAPDILAVCRSAMKNAERDASPSGHLFVRPDATLFASCRSQSIDYAVMEAYDQVVVLTFEGQWSDVGSWNAVASLAEADEDGNRVQGRGWAHLSRNTFIHAPCRPVVALGTSDLLLVDTPDAVLVVHQDAVERVKDVVTLLEKEHCAQALTHRKVARPWGWYDAIDAGKGFQVKRIGVKPGAALSLQKHFHRAEHWVVVKGRAEVVRGEETLLLDENQSTYIPVGVVHRLKNPTDDELEIIEIQSGDYLDEDDIVRLEDVYGRRTPSSDPVQFGTDDGRFRSEPR